MELVFLPEQQLLINFVAVSIKRSSLHKEWFRQGMKNIDELKDVNKKPPVSLVLNGKGVLTKKVKLAAEENPVLLVFPQANPAEFYYQVLHSGGFAFVSIARRSLVDQTITNVQQAGFKVLSVSLGFSAIEPLLSFLADGMINTTNYSLSIAQRNISDFELRPVNADDVFQQDEYLVSQQYLQPYDVLAFAAATDLLINNAEDVSSVNNETLDAQRDDFKHLRYLRAAGLSLITGVFVILLINFFVYHFYYERNNQYLVSGRAVSTQPQQLSDGIRDREAFLQEQGWLQQPRSSFFADRFAGFLPDGVWLSGLHFNPVNGNLLSSSGIFAFRKDTIQLNGACIDPDRINLFISNIRTMKEIKDVVMKNYSYKKEEDIGAFSLDIVTK